MSIIPNSTVLDKLNYLADNSNFMFYTAFQFAMSGTELWNSFPIIKNPPHSEFPANKFNLPAFSTSGKSIALLLSLIAHS